MIPQKWNKWPDCHYHTFPEKASKYMFLLITLNEIRSLHILVSVVKILWKIVGSNPKQQFFLGSCLIFIFHSLLHVSACASKSVICKNTNTKTTTVLYFANVPICLDAYWWITVSVLWDPLGAAGQANSFDKYTTGLSH